MLLLPFTTTQEGRKAMNVNQFRQYVERTREEVRKDDHSAEGLREEADDARKEANDAQARLEESSAKLAGLEDALSFIEDAERYRQQPTEYFLTILDTWKEWSQETAGDMARHHRNTAPDCEQVREGLWTAKEAERYYLADALKQTVDYVLDSLPCTTWQECTVQTLARAAFSDIEWEEIATFYLDRMTQSDAITGGPAL